jgi:hypothetical protein
MIEDRNRISFYFYISYRTDNIKKNKSQVFLYNICMIIQRESV